MDQQKHVHFVGIGGYGMSAIARILVDQGMKVTGSDVALSELAQKLQARGVQVMVGHDAAHIAGADIVVYSTSISPDNPEITAAKAKGIPLLHRSQMLARILNERTGIAVAGAHGKTTTTSMIAHILDVCGVDPTYVIGGELLDTGTNAKAGKSEYVVAEADESDGSFLEYAPALAVVTNIEPDHLEHFNGDFAQLKQAYARFLERIKPGGKAILCTDDPTIRELLNALPGEKITYGMDPQYSAAADFRITEITLADRKVGGLVWHRQDCLGPLTLNIAGRHNILNALAAVIVCTEIGVSFPQIASALETFRGAKRRFQIIGEVDDILVVDDYAHHPTEIHATLSGARASGRRVIAVFQPQRYTRTYFLMEEFSRAFAEADEVIITDIYSPPGEKKMEGVSAEVLVEKIRANSNPATRYISTQEEVQEHLLQRVRPGDLVLTMGAGDIWKTAYWLAEQLINPSQRSKEA